jgi:hypothetical protein
MNRASPPLAIAYTAEPPLIAVEEIRRMRGGSQSHLMRCSDGCYYVVKFQNNPQGTRVLVNEMLGTRLAGLLGLPIADNNVVIVSEELIRHSEEMVFEQICGRTSCTAGLCFGSRYPVDPRNTQIMDFVSDNVFSHTENISDFCGMLVFDKWTGNADDRQAVFFRKGNDCFNRAVMIDQGMCFNGSKWNFPDAPLQSMYRTHPAYERVCGMRDFQPWLTRLETEINPETISEVAGDIPPEWYAFDSARFRQLLESLNVRRIQVRELLSLAHDGSPSLFPNWIPAMAHCVFYRLRVALLAGYLMQFGL